MLTNSKSLPRYIRFMATNSGNSTMQGPHQVAQTFTTRSLPELFLSKSLIPASSICSRLTGSFAHSSKPFLIQSFFSAHLMEQPKTLVVFVVTSFFCNSSSKAFRVSKVLGVFVG